MHSRIRTPCPHRSDLRAPKQARKSGIDVALHRPNARLPGESVEGRAIVREVESQVQLSRDSSSDSVSGASFGTSLGSFAAAAADSERVD